MYVFAINPDKTPSGMLHPAEARRLLKSKMAKIFRQFPKVVILDKPVAKQTYEYGIKIDPGSKHTGLVVVRTHNEVQQIVFAAQIDHRREQIVESLTSRRSLRRARRGRKTRYRKMRFDRKKPDGWLPPSTNSVISNVETFVKKICKFCPISFIWIEQPKFDTQRRSGTTMTSDEYQNGPLRGYRSERSYLLNCSKECIYCGVTDVRLERDHIVPKSRGGSDRLANAVLSCRRCNELKGNRDVKDFLQTNPKRLGQILKILQEPKTGMAVINSIRFVLPQRLSVFAPVCTFPPVLTVENRQRFFDNKTHWIDAACVGEIEGVECLVKKVLLVKAKGHGSRQRVQTDRFGFPRRKVNGQKHQHKPRKKKFFGFQAGDIVKLPKLVDGQMCQLVGRVKSPRTSGSFTISTNSGDVSSTWKKLRAIHRSDGYSYEIVGLDVGARPAR